MTCTEFGEGNSLNNAVREFPIVLGALWNTVKTRIKLFSFCTLTKTLCKTVKSALGYNRTGQNTTEEARQSLGKESFGRGGEGSSAQMTDENGSKTRLVP